MRWKIIRWRATSWSTRNNAEKAHPTHFRNSSRQAALTAFETRANMGLRAWGVSNVQSCRRSIPVVGPVDTEPWRVAGAGAVDPHPGRPGRHRGSGRHRHAARRKAEQGSGQHQCLHRTRHRAVECQEHRRSRRFHPRRGLQSRQQGHLHSRGEFDRRRRDHGHLHRRHADSASRVGLRFRQHFAGCVRSRARRSPARAAGHPVRGGLGRRNGPLYYSATEPQRFQRFCKRRGFGHAIRRAELRAWGRDGRADRK